MNTTINKTWDPAWEEVFRSQQWGRYPSEHVIRFVARQFYRAADRRAIRLLDLGCGPGASTWFMAREGFSVSGIDGSPTAIEQAGARLAADGLSADLRVADYTELPWPDGHFDGVVDNATLCCNSAAGRTRTLASVTRVLKPGGWLLSANFTDRTWGYGLGTAVERGGFREITEGPLVGKGFCCFFGRADLDELYVGFEEMNVELGAWTLGGMAHLVEMWLVTCRNPR
jgi:SAM-dependent methyltransferase